MDFSFQLVAIVGRAPVSISRVRETTSVERHVLAKQVFAKQRATIATLGIIALISQGEPSRRQKNVNAQRRSAWATSKKGGALPNGDKLPGGA